MYFKKSFVNISVINRLDYVIWDATLADCKSVETVISNLILINLDRVPLWRRLLSDYNLLSILVGLNIFQWRSAMFSVKRSGFAHGSTKRNKVRWLCDTTVSLRVRELTLYCKFEVFLTSWIKFGSVLLTTNRLPMYSRMFKIRLAMSTFWIVNNLPCTREF